MDTHIKQSSRVVGTPPIAISTTCHQKSPFCITFAASKSESSISKPSLSVGRTALLPAKSSLPGLIRLPPWAPTHMRSPNSWNPKTAMMDRILMLWSKTSEHYSTIRMSQCTKLQYAAARGSLSSIKVVTWRIYRMNNCTQWSSVFTTLLLLTLSVSMVNPYPRWVNAQKARAGAEGINGTTGCG